MLVFRGCLPFLVLVLVLVQVGGGAAQMLMKGPCPAIPPMKHFEPDRFLGSWYEVARTFVSFEELLGTCWVDHFVFEKDKGYFIKVAWQDKQGNPFDIENGITLDEEEPGRFYYVVRRPNLPFLRGEYLILDTDYQYYALFWQCQNLPLNLYHTEILWLLSKLQSPTPKTITRAKDVVVSLGLDASLLQRQDRRKCLT